MRKVLGVLFLLIMAVAGWTQTTEIETVMEIQAERELADWIEGMLYPIVGDNVAIVDMTLRYPSEKLEVYGTRLNRENSVPGLPDVQSSGVMPSEIAGEETYPTIVLKKVVTVYLSDETSEEMVEFVRQNVASWVNINTEKENPSLNDRLEVRPILKLMAVETSPADSAAVLAAQESVDYRNYLLIIGGILLLIILIFIIVFSSRMGVLAKSLKEVNIPGLENAIRPPAVRQTATSESSADKGPINVRIMPENEQRKDILSFRFIEELSPNGVAKLLAQEKPEDAAYVLSQLSPDFVSGFLAEFQDNSDILINAIIKGKKLSHHEIKHLHEKLSKKITSVIEEEELSFDNHKFLTSLVNKLPAQSSEQLFNKINSFDGSFASLLRKNVFFLDDLANLENSSIGEIVRSIDRDILVRYLSYAPDSIKRKFFSVMTTRNQEIFRDELQSLPPLNNEDIEQNNNIILAEIRRILNLV